MSSCANSKATYHRLFDCYHSKFSQADSYYLPTRKRGANMRLVIHLTKEAAFFDEVFYRFEVVSESQMVARVGEYRGLFGRFRMGIQVRQYLGLFV